MRKGIRMEMENGHNPILSGFEYWDSIAEKMRGVLPMVNRPNRMGLFLLAEFFAKYAYHVKVNGLGALIKEKNCPERKRSIPLSGLYCIRI